MVSPAASEGKQRDGHEERRMLSQIEQSNLHETAVRAVVQEIMVSMLETSWLLEKRFKVRLAVPLLFNHHRSRQMWIKNQHIDQEILP